MSETDIENEIQAKGLNAPRLTPADIDNVVKPSATKHRADRVDPVASPQADIRIPCCSQDSETRFRNLKALGDTRS